MSMLQHKRCKTKTTGNYTHHDPVRVTKCQSLLFTQAQLRPDWWISVTWHYKYISTRRHDPTDDYKWKYYNKNILGSKQTQQSKSIVIRTTPLQQSWGWCVGRLVRGLVQDSIWTGQEMQPRNGVYR